MKVPVRPIRGAWPTWLQNRGLRHFYVDPSIVTNDEVDADLYRRAMFGIYVGGTIKITWSHRHSDVDALMREHLDLADAVILDMGASDGSTSVDLIRSLPRFRQFVISDLHAELGWNRLGSRTFLYDLDGTCVLVAGRRLVAWPHLSRGVDLLYRPLTSRARRAPTSAVSLLNPETRRLIDSDDRVSFRVHDIFSTWAGEPVDVIKTANVLRRLYFDDDRLGTALVSLHRSLRDGGHLVLADHSRVAGEPPAGGIYRRTLTGFERVAATQRHPEIDDLVTALEVPAAPER